MTPQLIDHATASITCITCRRTTTADPRHLENLFAAGPWTCDTCKAVTS